MKQKCLLFVALLFLFSSVAISQSKKEQIAPAFKIVGYYFLHAAISDSIHGDTDYHFLDKITHLNLAFINPDSTGHFQGQFAIDTLVKKAHQKGVKVLASIAGGGPHPYYATLLQEEHRPLFVRNLVSLVQQYHLDGIDVDIEGSDIDSNYERFVTALAATLHGEKKLLSAAIATAYRDQLPDKALQQFDYVTIMSYDRTGPWRPDSPGHHAPYQMAVDDLHYWNYIRAIPKEKMVLGLPFYGYGFGEVNTPVVSMDYKTIHSLYPNEYASDTLLLPEHVTMYYNSAATIQKKTVLAMQKASGVMIWQLLGDAAGDASLLKTIYDVVYH